MTERLEAAVAELVAALREETGPAALGAPDRLLSIGEARDALGIGRSLLFGEIGAGRLRSVRVGRRRLIPASAVAEYVASQPA
jgi:excisionase family DNA binding protein